MKAILSLSVKDNEAPYIFDFLQAFHNQMLQLCDKGAVLFADRYLSTHLAAAVSDNSFSGKLNNAATDISNRRILGPLIKSIIVDNMADVNLAMARRSLLLIKYVSLFCILILFYFLLIFTCKTNFNLTEK